MTGSGRPVHILVCAFGRFPGVPVNPSARAGAAMLRLRRPAIADLALEFEILPTRWDSLPRLDAVMEGRAPDGILLLGVAPRRRRICIETRAVNQASGAPDAARRHAPRRALSPGAPRALATTAPPRPLLSALRGFGLAATLSRDAGRYLCNASYFHALRHARAAGARTGHPPPVMFVHLPGRNGMPAGTDPGRLAAALSALLRTFAAEVRRTAQMR